MLGLDDPQACHQASVDMSILLAWFCSSRVMLLPRSIAARLISCLQVQVRRRSGRARVEEQAFRLTAPGVVEMLTAEQAAALQQQTDAQQAAGGLGRMIWAAAQLLCLTRELLVGCDSLSTRSPHSSAVLAGGDHSACAKQKQSSSEVHLAGVQIRSQCHLQTWLHHHPRTCLVA